MKLTIEPTPEFAELSSANGGSIAARVWDGTTESGGRVHVFVAAIAADVRDQLVNDELQRELIELNLGTARRVLWHPPGHA